MTYRFYFKFNEMEDVFFPVKSTHLVMFGCRRKKLALIDTSYGVALPNAVQHEAIYWMMP